MDNSWPCGCRRFRRCAVHAKRHAEEEMRRRGWLPLKDKDYEELKKLRDNLREKRIDVMDWHGKWAPEIVVAIFQCHSIPMHLRTYFFDKACQHGEFHALLLSTYKVGGADAVNQLLTELDFDFTVEALKSLVK